jgi:hypothetical protein
MRRAWRRYWRTVSQSWGRLTLRKRLLLAGAYALGGGLGALLLFVPGARLPVLIVLLVTFAADIPIALRRARRKP